MVFLFDWFSNFSSYSFYYILFICTGGLLMKKILFLLILILIIGVILYTNNIDDTNNHHLMENNIMEENEFISTIKLTVHGEELIIELLDHSSSRAFVEKLKEGNLKINAHDYGNFEKVGSLGFSLPTNDQEITAKPGDLILYQGNQITIYYDTNTWSFTKLGEVVNKSEEELRAILGEGDVLLEFSL